MYGFKLIEKPRDNYDAVIVAVSHDVYLNLDEKYFKALTYDNAVVVNRSRYTLGSDILARYICDFVDSFLL